MMSAAEIDVILPGAVYLGTVNQPGESTRGVPQLIDAALQRCRFVTQSHHDFSR